MALQDNTNNPGNLEATRAGAINYPGQTGTYSANGVNYAVFPDASTGYNALVDYIQRHVASGWSTVQQFVYGYLGTSTPNQANPYPANYLSTVENTSGISGAIGTNYNALAQGIVRAEGNSPVSTNVSGAPAGPLASAESALSAAINSTPGGFLIGSTAGALNGAGNLFTNNVMKGTQCIANPGLPGCGAAISSTPGGSLIAGTAGAMSGASSLLKGLTIQKIALTVLGVAIIIAALVLLGSQNKTIQQVAASAVA